MRESNMNSHHL